MNYRKQKIHDTSHSTIFYYPDIKLTEILWLESNLMTSDAYHDTFEQILEFAKKNKIPCILSDIRKQGVVAPTEKKWFKQEMFPKAVCFGLKKVAVVSNDNIFKTYYLNALNKIGSNLQINFKSFNDYNKAFNWLTKNLQNN